MNSTIQDYKSYSKISIISDLQKLPIINFELLKLICHNFHKTVSVMVKWLVNEMKVKYKVRQVIIFVRKQDYKDVGLQVQNQAK